MASAGGAGSVAVPNAAATRANVEMAAPLLSLRRDWREGRRDDVSSRRCERTKNRRSMKRYLSFRGMGLDTVALGIPQRNTVSFLQLNSNQYHD